MLHDPALERRPDLLHAVLDAAAVAVEIGRLRVELRLQLAEVESSRTRIAQAGYAERRRLERDLHDGAQQRLVTLGIVLRRLQRSLPGEAKILAPALDAAVDEVAATIADLRTIAAGVRPPRLDEGLTAALEDLARGAAVPVELEATRRPRAAGGRGGRLLHRVRGAHQRGQARVAVARDRCRPTRERGRPAARGGRRRRRRRRAGRPAAGSRGWPTASPPRAGRSRSRARPARARGSRWSCRARRDRRGHRAAARGARRAARGRRARGRRPRRRRRGAARARRRARARARRRRRPHAARLRRRGHARGGGDPPLPPRHRRARPLPAHRDAPRRRARRRPAAASATC